MITSELISDQKEEIPIAARLVSQRNDVSFVTLMKLFVNLASIFYLTSE